MLVELVLSGIAGSTAPKVPLSEIPGYAEQPARTLADLWRFGFGQFQTVRTTEQLRDRASNLSPMSSYPQISKKRDQE